MCVEGNHMWVMYRYRWGGTEGSCTCSRTENTEDVTAVEDRCGGTEDSCAAGQRRQKVWWD